jgi:signal transduction histidine kinase
MLRFPTLAVGGGRSDRFLLLCMVFGFLSLLAAGIAAVRVIDQNQQHTRAVAHTYEVELAVGGLNVAIERAETARRGFLLTSSRAFLGRYRSSIAAVEPGIAELRALTADNAAQQARIASLTELQRQLVGLHDATNTMVLNGSRDEALRRFTGERDAQVLQAIRALLDRIGTEERTLLRVRDAEQREGVRNFFTILAVAGLLLVALAAISILTMRRYTSDLARTGDQLRALNDTLENAVRERTADLSRANEEIQRFAYIVSHDLRSPLVNVMGFTAELEAGAKAIAAMVDRAEAAAPEVVDDHARLAAREDLPEAIGFIRTSTAKMDALINAILKLSREGRRVITPERVDMGELVSTIREALQHRLDERGGTITVEGVLPTIVTDRVAIDQILSNLIENAVKYADPARPVRITVRGRTEGARALLEVQDNGRGIDARDHERIFDLFRRAGQQDQPGEGIGLAHVRALTYRLGGVIDVASKLGEGATFSVSLPLEYRDARAGS